MKKNTLLIALLFACHLFNAQTLVKDIFPGNNSGFGEKMVALGNVAIFIGSDNSHGYELWRSDGTTLGTTMIMDINTGSNDGLAYYDGSFYYYSPLYVFGNKVYFYANEPGTGMELWSTDGTPGGTAMVKDIDPGPDNSVFNFDAVFMAVNGYLYFRAYNGTDGHELWRTDGTSGGTTMVKNINSAANTGSYPNSFFTDGTALYFSANDGTSGYELWKSDGTTLGTSMLLDINPGSNSSFSRNFISMGSKIYFSADNGTNGSELWVTDGTGTGTQMLLDMRPGPGNGAGAEYILYHDVLYFMAMDGFNGPELWRSDGTAAGTYMLKNIQQGAGGGAPSNFCVYNDLLYFTADDGTHGSELWITNGSTLGTSMFIDINNVSSQSSNPLHLTVANGGLYFTATDGTNGVEMWRTDGNNTSGTNMLTQICPGSCDAYPFALTKVDNMLMFGASESAGGRELYKLDLPASAVGKIRTNAPISAYPNPCASELMLKGTVGTGMLSICDLQGRELIHQNTEEGQTVVNTALLTTGVYMLRYDCNGKVFCKRIEKM